MDTLTDASICSSCSQLNAHFCAGQASLRTYIRLENLLFGRIWPCLSDGPLRASRVARRYRTLAELDEALSTGGGRTEGDRQQHQPPPYLQEPQVQALERAAEADGLRASLMVALLLTTGLRRQGLVNICIRDVARWDESAQRWQPDRAGSTWEKGKRRRSFPVYPPVQALLDRWLNAGIRPPSPSEYLFPSALSNNGQLCADSVRHIFVRLARCAQLPRELHHVHVMRHTCAHRLLELGNTARQIAAYLGHASASTTERYYLQDRVETITASMVKPATWLLGGQPTTTTHHTTSNNNQRGGGPPLDVVRMVLDAQRQRRAALPAI